ncbi:hypothetical protein H6P81_002517 [Aristolochia fimbriata]|uniref:Alpha-1,3-glucosyltransferase n=1 Tax=Aristolochia fimbriata TaxID=158543 RepID=A0AAV7FAJ2_ARIFI|nr:hypothetical protein H6P81_002517 [Aristolochia fimbriata]
MLFHGDSGMHTTAKIPLPSVALVSSRGHESPLGKLLMRCTVLLSDALVFFPAAIYFILVYCVHRGRKDASLWLLAMILLNHALIVIDHGYFQKSAYFAPAFFAHLLGKCLKRKYPLLEVLKLGIVVVVTFAVMWWPYLYSVDAVMEVYFSELSNG